MKAHRATTPPAFVPVIVTLENQDEVDELFALVNNSKLMDMTPGLSRGCGWESLQDFANRGVSSEIHRKLNSALS